MGNTDHTTPLSSLYAVFPRPGSLLKVAMGMWATPAGRAAAAVPAQPPPALGKGEEKVAKPHCCVLVAALRPALLVTRPSARRAMHRGYLACPSGPSPAGIG